jgi:hypothetical protein
MINYNNLDYSCNVINRQFSTLNIKLVNEFKQPIYDAPDYLLQIQISVFDKDTHCVKEAALQALKLLNDVYFTLLNMISMMVKNEKSHFGLD